MSSKPKPNGRSVTDQDVIFTSEPIIRVIHSRRCLSSQLCAYIFPLSLLLYFSTSGIIDTGASLALALNVVGSLYSLPRHTPLVSASAINNTPDLPSFDPQTRVEETQGNERQATPAIQKPCRWSLTYTGPCGRRTSAVCGSASRTGATRTGGSGGGRAAQGVQPSPLFTSRARARAKTSCGSF